MTPEDYNTIQRMQALGGNFVKSLADAYTAADSVNQTKLKAMFAEAFSEFGDEGELAKFCPNCKKCTGRRVAMPATSGFQDGYMRQCEDCERQWGHG